MSQPKSILPIVYGLIIVALVFYGGAYFSQKVPFIGTQLDPCSYLDLCTGYGIIDNIDVDNSTITMISQVAEDKIFEAKLNQDTRFYQVAKGGKYVEGEYVPLEGEEITLEDLQIDDQVYFYIRSSQDGDLTLLWLNVKSK